MTSSAMAWPSLGNLAPATVALGRGSLDRASALGRVDAYVTSRGGYQALFAERRLDGEHWQEHEASLAAALARAAMEERVPADAAQVSGAAIAARAMGVARVVSLSEAPERRALLDTLVRARPVRAGVDPYRPVAVPVTAMTQTQLDLGADLGGVRLRMASAGRPDTPHLLLIHGHASRIEEYEALAALLAPTFHLRIVDLPGCGYSEKPRVIYSLAYFERVLERVLDVLEVGAKTPTTFVAGGGLGGNLALRLAYRDGRSGRARIARVAAWSVAGWGKTRRLLALGSRLVNYAPNCIFDAVAKAQLDQQYSASWPERSAMIASGMDYRHEVFTRTFKTAYCAIAAEQVGTSMLAHARDMRAPVMLLAGELDKGRLDIRGAVESLAAAMGIAPVIVKGSGYAIANEKPDELASRLRSHFARPGSEAVAQAG